MNDYDGTPMLLDSGWNDVPRNGNAFPFATGGGVHYALRTAFDEGAVGAPLAGTAPAAGSGVRLQNTGMSPAFVVGGISVPTEDAADATVIDSAW